MTNGELSPIATSPPTRLAFEGLVLDLARGNLLREGTEIELRPKTFAVLKYLVENSGRLVAKEELFAAVWPNLAVTDDALVQSIGELRRALGEAGPRLIKTVPRRGYRFDATVSLAAPVAAARNDARPAASASWQRTKEKLSAAIAARSTPSIVAASLLLIILIGAGTWTSVGYLRSAPQPTTSIVSNATGSIAILPFFNRGDQAGDYFADGLTQDIISALGRFSTLTVMSWNAVLPYRTKPATPGAIARELGVHYQVEGTVQRSGERVRVTAQLVASDGRVLWSGRFDQALAELLALQDKITNEIAGALAIRVTQFEHQRVLAKPTQSLEAYDYVLRARPALQRPTRANNAEARALLRRAVELDPNSAAAYAELAETYHIAVSLGWAESPNLFLNRAEEMASKALSLDDAQVRAHIILGRIHMFRQQYDRAKAEIERAIAINPSDAHGLAGRGNILMWSGQTDAAIDALELAQRIDPELNAIDRFALSLAHYLKRHYDTAVEQAQRTLLATGGAHFSRVVLAAAYAQQQRRADAARVVTEIRRTNPTFDPETFGTKFLNAADLEHLRDGLRKAGLYVSESDAARIGGAR